MPRPKGSKMSEAAKLKISIAGKGRRHTAETRKKMSDAHKGRTYRSGFHWSEETKQKMSEAQLGSKNHRWNKSPWNKGLAGFLAGSLSPHWQGGITPLVIKIRHNVKYRDWRAAVFVCDNFTCQLCGSRGHNLQADHYPRSFAEIFYANRLASIEQALNCAELWDVANGRTLCRPCHKATDTYLQRFKK